MWNLITWFFGFPSSSSHALIGGMVGAVLIAHGIGNILWGGLLYVVASLVISPVLGLIFGMLFLKMTLRILKMHAQGKLFLQPDADPFFHCPCSQPRCQ